MRTVTLTVNHWDGDLPLPGEFLKAARGRTAYMVVMIKRLKPGSKAVAKLICERYPATALPADARVYGWEWAKR